jgi:hypothetical protein
MRTIHLSTDTRTKMARTLAKFLKERERVEIKHSVANQAVAVMLGMNEHSLAATIREPGGVKLLIDEPAAPRLAASTTSTTSGAPIPDYGECLKRVIEFVNRPEVASFTIGMTGPNLAKRLRGYDHHDYGGRRQGWAIATGLDEKGALDLEKYLCLAAGEVKYRTTPLYIKYDDKHRPYFPSAGGAKTVSPHAKIHQVYLAWRHESLPAGWRGPGNRAFLEAMVKRHEGDAEVHRARTDADFLGALENGDKFFVSMRIKLHFHTRDCKLGLRGGNYTRIGTKATSTSFVALYHWAQRHRPERLADEDQWHICNCCKNLLA